MQGRKEEIIIVSLASLLLIGVFGAISYFDRPHQDVGAEYGLDQVRVSISGTEGDLGTTDFPEGLIVFGAGGSGKLDITVSNSDPDNDIDTIRITIPGAVMTNSSYSWGEAGEKHEWNSTIAGDIITFTALTDYAGMNFGGSAQYDTAGDVDDALDHDEGTGESESITLTVIFNAPSEPGLRSGDAAIDVEVADLKTEDANPMETFSPFPYPYWVAQSGAEFIVMVLDTPTVDLEVVYGTETYFGASRGVSGIETEAHGIKYITTDGKAIAVIEKPTDDTIVKPVIRPLSAGLTGQFNINVYVLEIADLAQDPIRTPVATDYKEDIPSTMIETVDLDIDSDGIYNNADPDMDGDGQENSLDRAPRDRNVQELAPTGLQASSDKAMVKEGEAFTLTAHATDGNSDPITYTWSVDKIAGWSRTGSSVPLKAEGDLEAGETYTFTVTATDNRHPDRPTDDVTITIEKEEGGDNIVLIIVIVAVLFVMVALALFFIFRKKEGDGSTEAEDVAGPAKQDQEAGPGPADLPQDAGAASKKTDDYVIEEAAPKAEAVTSKVEKAHEDVDDLEAFADYLDSSDTCPECGTLLGKDDTKCSRCGAEFDIELICPECDSPLNPDDKKCPGCGIQFD